MSWLDVGGIISDYSVYPFNRIKLKPLVIGDLNSLFNARKHKSIQTLVNVLQDHVDIDVECLRVLDFKYLLHWLKQKSFPENSITCTWRCNNYPLHVRDFPKRYAKDPSLEALSSNTLYTLGYERTHCGRLNTEIVYQVRTTTKQIGDYSLPKGYKFPTVKDLLEADDLADDPEFELLADYLMWIDSSSLQEAKEDFDWLDDCSNTMYTIDKLKELEFGTRVNYQLTCAACGKEYPIRKDLDIFDILPGIEQSQVMDLQYNIFGQFPGAVMSEDTPCMKLFYWHSCLVKDKQAQEEAKARQGASSHISPSLKAKYNGKR